MYRCSAVSSHRENIPSFHFGGSRRYSIIPPFGVCDPRTNGIELSQRLDHDRPLPASPGLSLVFGGVGVSVSGC
jgi:hypothetical protein